MLGEYKQIWRVKNIEGTYNTSHVSAFYGKFENFREDFIPNSSEINTVE